MHNEQNGTLLKINPVAAGKVVSAADIPTSAPVEGKWYCAMNWNEGMAQYNGGSLAQYVGDGQFYDEDDTEHTREMRDADFIQEQH